MAGTLEKLAQNVSRAARRERWEPMQILKSYMANTNENQLASEIRQITDESVARTLIGAGLRASLIDDLVDRVQEIRGFAS